MDDVNTPLIERGLDEYEKGHDALHNTKGHMNQIFSLFEKEDKFNNILAFQNLKKYLHRNSFKDEMKGSDWRYYFVQYKNTLLPCIWYEKQQAKLIIETWLEIQFICYKGINCIFLFLFNLGMKTQVKSRQLCLRFWLATFVHGLYCIRRWGKQVMSLYLHNIWIHWPKDFEKIEFSQEGTDLHEAWLSTVKRILKYMTNKKEGDSLIELIIRTSMQDQDFQNTEKSWNKIGKAFQNYNWIEYKISSTHISSSLDDWKYFLNRINSAGYSEEKGDYEIENSGTSWQIQFKTLPFFNL